MTTPLPDVAPPRATVVYPVPMERKYMGQLVLPRDLTQAECDRLCEMLKTLVMP